MQVAHRQNGGISTRPLGPVTPWSALCHIGSRCPGSTPRPIAAQTRQGFLNKKTNCPLPPRVGLKGRVCSLGTISTLNGLYFLA